MKKYIFQRILWACITLFVILFILFLLLEFMPGSPFNEERLTLEQLARLRESYGLDKPFFEKFLIFLKNAAHGDFGLSYSIVKNGSVADLVMPRLWTSVRIGLQALVLGSFLGVILGTISGVFKNTWMDTLATVIAVIGVSVPSFVFALTLSFTLGFELKWFKISYVASQPFFSSILPTIALSMFIMAQVTRFLRTEFVEVLDTEYIRLARVKGASKLSIIFKHGFRNALISVITIFGPLVVNLLTGSLVVEKIFSIPGIGSMLVTAIQSNDYNVIVMIAFIYSALYIFVNLIVDILYGIIDPRIRVAKAG